MTTTLRKGLLATTAAAGFVLALTAGASAQTPINGGGSTLAGVYYQTIFATLNDPTVAFNYALVGSGSGRAAFVGQVASKENYAAGTVIDFGASDFPLSATEIATYNTTVSAKGGSLIELPTFGTPITFPYFANQNTYTKLVKGQTGYPGYSKTAIASTISYTKIVLNDSDLCGIFSGKITDWSMITGTAATVLAPTTGKTTINGPITVVYRSDNSGTTSLLTQHLAAVCTPANSAITFTATGVLSSLFPNGVPSNFVGASGSGGVANTIAGNPAASPAVPALTSAIAYLSPDYTALNTGTAIQTQYKNLHTASVINTNDGKAYTAKYSNVTMALSNPGATDTVFTAPTSATLAANQNTWIPLIANPKAGYPVVGYTTIAMAQCYQTAAVGTSLQSLITSLYSAQGKSTLTAAGFAQLPSAESKVINYTFFPTPKINAKTHIDANANGTSPYNFSLNLGNVTVCAGKGL